MTEHLSGRTGGDAVAVEVLDHTIAVRPTGEIDVDTAPSLEQALKHALVHASPAKDVVVDCSGLTCCDSSGLNTLLAIRRAAQESDTVIRLASPAPQLHRLLEMTGTLALFPIDQDPPAAA
ncbi:STAS domain-containing protein [Streptomyces sp. NPDC056883]|uniref:STAS domain-containing protein n=1 Tax=Streptomyces sp. NPDC056883 TaxID=3345959 RepID=UPI00368D90F7